MQAAEQCGRSRIPVMHRPMALREGLEHASGKALSLMPWERENSHFLDRALKDNHSSHINLFIGPEGGFTDEEVAIAHSRGTATVSLGKRILRSETAAILATAVVLYALGEMG